MQRVAEPVERQGLHVKLDVGALAMRIGAGEDAKLRRRHGERPAPAQCVIESHQAAPHQRVVGLIQRAHAGYFVDRALLQMILQIASDTSAIEHDIDPERREPLGWADRSEEHTSELQSLRHLVCRLLLEKKKNKKY